MQNEKKQMDLEALMHTAHTAQGGVVRRIQADLRVLLRQAESANLLDKKMQPKQSKKSLHEITKELVF